MAHVSARIPEQILRTPDRFHTTGVRRAGDVVLRDPRPWSATVHALLRHLESVGFAAAPRVIEPGFDARGYETLTFIEGDVQSATLWSPDAAFAIGQLFRALHDATATWQPPHDAGWYAWFGRDLGGPRQVIGHCDPGPWNIVARHGMPIALIDWEWAGPVDPLIELAQVCWLNAGLHDDIVAEREGLPSLAERARRLRAIVDGYGLSATERRGLVSLIIEVAIHDTAAEADLAAVRPESTPADLDQRVPWALAWRARAASWQLRHRAELEQALT
jgi:Phosphotransferase enzyme family